MADPSCTAVVSEAQSSIKSLKQVISAHKNIANDVKSAMDKSLALLLATIKAQDIELMELKAKIEDMPAIDTRFHALENVNKRILQELSEIKSQMLTKTYSSIVSSNLNTNRSAVRT